MKGFFERISKLICVKSVMTLMLTFIFCKMSNEGIISGTEFLTIFTMIVGFYFGVQSKKE